MTTTTAQTHAGPGHTHGKLYVRTGAILTVITAFEIGILFVPFLKPVYAPMLVTMAIVKFAMVVGTFMHLRDDRPIYRLLFVAPLFAAFGCFSVVALLTAGHYGPFGKGYAITVADQRAGFQLPAGAGGKAEPPWPEARLQAAFAAVSPEELGKGKQIFATTCASCHRPDGGGMPGLGPNMTDECYIHGGQLGQMYATVANGVPGKAMPSWRPVLSPEQMRQVTFYLRSLRGSQVAGGRPCEGLVVP